MKVGFFLFPQLFFVDNLKIFSRIFPKYPNENANSPFIGGDVFFMDDKIDVNMVVAPSLECLSDAEFEALCTALFFEIEKIVNSEGENK